MKMSRITLLAFAVTRLIDSGAQLSADEVFQLIEDRNLFDKLQQNYGDLGIMVDGIRLLNQQYPDDKQELLDALDRLASAVIPENLSILNRSNGLLFLNAMLNQLIQSNVEEIRLA